MSSNLHVNNFILYIEPFQGTRQSSWHSTFFWATTVYTGNFPTTCVYDSLRVVYIVYEWYAVTWMRHKDVILMENEDAEGWEDEGIAFVAL